MAIWKGGGPTLKATGLTICVIITGGITTALWMHGDLKSSDQWTAYGTIGLALATFVLAGVTVALANRDRKNAEKQILAEQARGAEEREQAEKRLKEERDLFEERRKTEIREAAIAELLRYMAPVLSTLSGLHDLASLLHGPGATSDAKIAFKIRDTLRELQHGLWTAGIRLDHPEAAARYRTFVGLVLTVATSEPRRLANLRYRDMDDLRNYGRWVRLGMRQFLASGELPQISDGPSSPVLGRDQDLPAWQPSPVPAGWAEDTALDILDPDFRRAP